MILTYDQAKWLVKTKESGEQFVFVGNGKATKKEKQRLQEMDEFHVFCTGTHLIANYEDLEK